MGLLSTTTRLTYARNDLIKVGRSFIFDKVGDMIYYAAPLLDKANTFTAATTFSNTVTVGVNDTGYDVKLFGATDGVYLLWDEDADALNFVNARQNWTTTGLAITNAAGNARQLYGQFTADSIADAEHLTAMQLRASWAGTEDEDEEGLTGAEIKARASGTEITHELSQARAIVGNVDCKKATFTVGHIFEAQADLASGGEITTLKAFRASLNNSGTVGTGYAFIVETANTTYNWDYGFYCGTSMADIGLYIGSATTGIQLAGTQTTGIVIGSSVVTGISVDSATDSTGTTDGSIHTDGGLGVAKKLYVGSDIVATKSTGADVNVNGIFETLTVTGNCTGSVCGFRVRAVTDGTARTIGNFYGANVDARLVNASDALSGIMAGLQVAVSLGVCTTGSLWVYGINIDLSEAGGARATAIKAFIDFQDYDYDGSYPCQHLFDVGGSASRCSTGTSGDIEYRETLHILVNTNDRYIPLSTVEGTLTRGSDGTDGRNVVFYGDLASTYLKWDSDINRLTIQKTYAADSEMGTYDYGQYVGMCFNDAAPSGKYLSGVKIAIEGTANFDSGAAVWPLWIDYQNTGTDAGTESAGIRISCQTGSCKPFQYMHFQSYSPGVTHLFKLPHTYSPVYTGGSGTFGGTVKKISINIGGTEYFLVASTSVT